MFKFLISLKKKKLTLYGTINQKNKIINQMLEIIAFKMQYSNVTYIRNKIINILENL